jgi:hypothetical protein
MVGTMQYRLRTLLTVLALGPPLLWGGWLAVSALAEPEPEVDVFVISCTIGDETDSQTASPDEN